MVVRADQLGVLIAVTLHLNSDVVGIDVVDMDFHGLLVWLVWLVAYLSLTSAIVALLLPPNKHQSTN